MNSKRVAFLLILTVVAALCLIGFGSLLSNWRVATITSGIPDVIRVMVDERSSSEERIRAAVPERQTLDLPVGIPRIPSMDGVNLNPGQTVILKDHRLASIGDFARSSLSLGFRLAGIFLLAMGAVLLFRQRYEIVKRDPPVKKA